MYLAGFSISVLPPPLQHTNDGDGQTFVGKMLQAYVHERQLSEIKLTIESHLLCDYTP